MYLPDHFVEAKEEDLLQTLSAFPLGTLVVNGPQGLDANHVPFFFERDKDGKRKLVAHVARGNPLWRESTDGQEVLVVFRADDAYISPNWYPTKHETHRLVPTWNYRVVHVHGRLFIRDDVRFVRGVVARLTKTHEAQAGDPKPWKMTDSAPEYIDEMLTKIVGIEVEVATMVGKWKLSQNREERDLKGAAAELQKRGADTLAAAMLGTLGGDS
jgi:transcriptional regulator